MTYVLALLVECNYWIERWLAVENTEQCFSVLPCVCPGSRFKQQKLPAWKPVFTAGCVIPLFFIFGLVFIPVGVVLLLESNMVYAGGVYWTSPPICACMLLAHDKSVDGVGMLIAHWSLVCVVLVFSSSRTWVLVRCVVFVTRLSFHCFWNFVVNICLRMCVVLLRFWSGGFCFSQFPDQRDVDRLLHMHSGRWPGVSFVQAAEQNYGGNGWKVHLQSDVHINWGLDWYCIRLLSSDRILSEPPPLPEKCQSTATARTGFGHVKLHT